MRLEHESLDDLRRWIRGIVGLYLDLSQYRLFFFGSRVTGRGDDRSDIDVGIEGPEPIPFQVIGSIQEGLKSLPTLYSIDVVDFKSASPQFREVALKAIETIAPNP